LRYPVHISTFLIFLYDNSVKYVLVLYLKPDFDLATIVSEGVNCLLSLIPGDVRQWLSDLLQLAQT